jgi:glycosyltransferase involved in cell wall biosynthesis
MDLDDTRIAHVNLSRGFRGGERQTELLIQGLADRGLRQKLVARRGETLAERCAGIPSLEIVTVRNNVLSAAAALSDVDLVHIHEGRAVQAGYLNQKLRGVPYLVTRRVQKGPQHNPITRAMYRQAVAIVALSKAVQASVSALDAGLECELIPDSIGWVTSDAHAVDEIRARVGGEFIFGNIGELDDSHKGQRQIIAVARRLLDQVPGLTFVLVGSGRDQEQLKQEASDLPNVKFVGRVNNVGDYLRAFDAFIYPSRHEGLGSILLDSLACGLPIVATNVGGIPELLDDGVNGILCAPNDLDSLMSAVLQVYRDSALRERLSQANIQKAAQFSCDEMTGRYVNIYGRLLKEQGLETALI